MMAENQPTPAQRYVETYAPSQVASIADRETFFQELEDERFERFDEILADLMEPYLPWSQEYLADPVKVMGTTNRLRKQAEEMAMQEVVYDRFPPDETPTTDGGETPTTA